MPRAKPSTIASREKRLEEANTLQTSATPSIKRAAVGKPKKARLRKPAPECTTRKRGTVTDKSVQCDICDMWISRKADLPRHKKTHEDREEVSHRCSICGHTSIQKSNITIHMLTHLGEKPYACPDCDWTTRDPASLTRHRKNKHDYQPDYSSGARRRLEATVRRNKAKAKAPDCHGASERASSDQSARAQSSSGPSKSSQNEFEVDLESEDSYSSENHEQSCYEYPPQANEQYCTPEFTFVPTNEGGENEFYYSSPEHSVYAPSNGSSSPDMALQARELEHDHNPYIAMNAAPTRTFAQFSGFQYDGSGRCTLRTIGSW